LQPATPWSTGEDGKAIARNPGQIRFEIDVDHGGTPNDPSDGEELDSRIVKESTGGATTSAKLRCPH
jgi:hypothetical protein